MKCPKCHYLSFDPEPRCRNCGYDLSLASPPDLDLKTDPPYEGPFVDLALRGSDTGQPGRRESNVVTLGPIDLDRVVGIEEPQAGSDAPPLRVVPARDRAPETSSPAASPARRAGTAGRGRRAPSTTAELPLFVKNRPEPDPDAPLVTVPATPTPPLAVRRAHEMPKPRPAPGPSRRDGGLGPFERDLLQDLKRLQQRVARHAGDEAGGTVPATPTGPRVAGRRLAAAAIDATLLGGISVAVLWATLRVCDLGLGEAATLPIVPLAAFLLLVAAGYLLMFTVAGGQTVGKMLMRLRVVGSEEDGHESLTPRQAAVRALLTMPSVLVLGLGFLPALAGHGQTMHDRLSHTRVVPA